MNKNENILKDCSFYASDCHLVAMLLPHINQSVNKGVKIVPILEKDMQGQIEYILSKLRLKNESKINNINWKNTKINSESFKGKLNNTTNNELDIIVCGSTDYIKKANMLIEEVLSDNISKKNVRIIDCYYIEDELDIRDILNNHDRILNTAGEKTVEEFEKTLRSC